MDICYFPKANVCLVLNSISTMRFYPPKEIKLDFPEMKTLEKRKSSSDWKCVITTVSGEVVNLRGKEAETFCYAMSKNIRELKYSEIIEKDLEDEE